MSLSSWGRETVQGLILTSELAQISALLYSKWRGPGLSLTPACHQQHLKRTHQSDGYGKVAWDSGDSSQLQISSPLALALSNLPFSQEQTWGYGRSEGFAGGPPGRPARTRIPMLLGYVKDPKKQRLRGLQFKSGHGYIILDKFFYLLGLSFSICAMRIATST